MLGWVSTVLIGAVAVVLVWYSGARLGRLVRTSTGPQIIGILIAIDIVGALVLVLAFPDYLWLTMAGALIAAMGLGVLLVKTVVAYRANPHPVTDLSWVTAHWRRLFWISLGMAASIVLVALVSHSAAPLLLLLLPMTSLMLGITALGVVRHSLNQTGGGKS